MHEVLSSYMKFQDQSMDDCVSILFSIHSMLLQIIADLLMLKLRDNNKVLLMDPHPYDR